MSNIFSIIFNPDFLFTAIRVTTPILFAALACMMFYKGGVDAIGTEGIMLLSSLAGVIAGHYTKSFVLGVILGGLFGSFISIVYVILTNVLRSNDILAGVAVNTFANGFTVFILLLLTGEKGSSQNLPSPVVPNINIPIIKDIPILGDIISGHSLLTYVAVLFVILSFIFLYKTAKGLQIRSAGLNYKALESVGIDVLKVRYLSAGIAGFFAGLGGVFMSMSYINNFTRGMVAGRGFIGMAAEGMGRGNPFGVAASSLLFGAVDALSIQLQGMNIPARLIQSIPYIMTIVVISLYSYINKKNIERKEGK